MAVTRASGVGCQAVAVAYAVIAAGLIMQPERFSNTPSYHNLLIFLPAQAWGAVYGVTGVLLLTWFAWHPSRNWGFFTHASTLALTVWWLAAFIVRYLTDPGTTVVNVVSWSMFAFLVARSALSVDSQLVRGRAGR